MLLLLSLISACSDSSNKPGVNAQVEASAGDATYQWLEARYGVIRGPELDTLLIMIYERLSAGAIIACQQQGITCQFPEVWYSSVINSPTPSAFSSAGGRLFLSKGIILKIHNEDELAAIISHEMAHHLLGHTKQALELSLNNSASPQSEGSRPNAMFSLEQELAADDLGVRILYWSAYHYSSVLEAIDVAYELPEIAGAQEAPPWLQERTGHLSETVKSLPQNELPSLPSRHFASVRTWLANYDKTH